MYLFISAPHSMPTRLHFQLFWHTRRLYTDLPAGCAHSAERHRLSLFSGCARLAQGRNLHYFRYRAVAFETA